jgi:hypothetical protein
MNKVIGIGKKVLPFYLFAFLPLNMQAQKLTITKQTIDIGRTGYEVPVTATFELRNKGSRKLVIRDVKPDCSCTKVEFPKGEIGSGDKFTIRMTYDSRMLGHFNKQAAIISNASEKPVYITMTGVVLAELKDYSGNYPFDFNHLLSKANNMEFDNVKKGEQRTFEMEIMNNGSSIMQPNILHLPPYLSAVVSPERLSPGHSGKIVFTLNSDKIHDYGLTQTNVYLAQQLGEKVNSETEIGVTAVLVPPVKQVENAPQLVLSDTTLVLDFHGKSKKSGEIVVANSGKSQLDITSLQMFTRGLKVTLGKTRLAPNETTKLKITGVAEDLKKARSAPRVLMITNDPRQPKVVITINSKL